MSARPRKPLAVFVVGPTATGKTAAAVALARRLNGEIISCDSMQVYRGMPVITSQPAAGARKGIRHHLIGFLPPSKQYDVTRYRREALAAMKKIEAAGKLPVFVGGTGLYMSILVDGIFRCKKPAPGLRRKLEEEGRVKGSAALHRRLAEVDPDAAGRIHPNDLRRIVRALEVYETTGTPISLLQKNRVGLAASHEVKIFCLTKPKEELHAAIARRVDAMLRKGAVREVARLLRGRLSPTAMQAIGVREISGYLRGEYDRTSARDQMVRATCLYAKRQMTWFRKESRLTWVHLVPGASASGTAKTISAMIAAGRHD